MNIPVKKSLVSLSVCIPVYNEEAVLDELFRRLYPVLDGLDRSYEVIFIDDGSRDRSAAMLREQFQARPDTTRVVYLKVNAGQHAALEAGFAQARGQSVMTIDADLQNPPEEIPKLLEKIDEGHDYVGSIRAMRHDSQWRKVASRWMNRLRERLTGISITDQGCMMRCYDRAIIEAILQSREATTFIPVLAYIYAARPTEVVVEHEDRAAGESKYSLLSLIQLNFDLMTSFSIVPLQTFSILGMVVAFMSLVLVVVLAIRRLVIGPEAEGLFTLFGIAFFLIGICLFGIGLLGEYIGRLYKQVRRRPRYMIAAVLSEVEDSEADD